MKDLNMLKELNWSCHRNFFKENKGGGEMLPTATFPAEKKSPFPVQPNLFIS